MSGLLAVVGLAAIITGVVLHFGVAAGLIVGGGLVLLVSGLLYDPKNKGGTGKGNDGNGPMLRSV